MALQIRKALKTSTSRLHSGGKPVRARRISPGDDLQRKANSATGIRAGAFVVRPEIINQFVFVDNVFEAPVKVSDTAQDVNEELQIASDWSRNAVWSNAQ